MKFQLETNSQQLTISACRPGAITINQEELGSSLIITPESLIRDWPPQSHDELEPEHFSAVAVLEPVILIYGSGITQRFPAPELLAPLIQKGIGVETMDTAAACRTYNVLVSEGRNVAAALIIEQ